MKKGTVWILALLLAVAMLGCGEKNTGPEPGTPVHTFYQAVLEAQPEGLEELIFFEESGPELIQSFYPGLEKIELNQQAFYMPPIATHPCEIVLVEVKNSQDVPKVAEIFQARIDMGADDTTYPESAAGWQQYAQVHTGGNFVCMIVLPGGYLIPETVFAETYEIPPVTEPAATTPPAVADYTAVTAQWHTALSQQWDASAYEDKGMSPLAVNYYGGDPLANVGCACLDLNGDGAEELIIGAILNAEQEPLVFEIWTLQDGKAVMVARSDAGNRYYLQFAEENDLWSVACEAEKDAQTRGTYGLQLTEGQLQVTQGILYDGKAAEPWFMTYDLDWDTANDSPVDAETAQAVMEAARNLYTTADYTPLQPAK